VECYVQRGELADVDEPPAVWARALRGHRIPWDIPVRGRP
jgi:hypothetical protein